MESFGQYILITEPKELVESYQRCWRERLLSWPWRPWIRWGKRPTTYSLMKARVLNTQEAMRKNMEQKMFSTFGDSDGLS